MTGLPPWSGRYAVRVTTACLVEYGDTCHLCLLSGATTADHLLPRSRGGDDSLANLRPAHQRCNSRRQARLLSTELLATFRTDAWRRVVIGTTPSVNNLTGIDGWT